MVELGLIVISLIAALVGLIILLIRLRRNALRACPAATLVKRARVARWTIPIDV